MSFLGSSFGIGPNRGDGAAGLNYQAQFTPLQIAVNEEQMKQANSQVGTGLDQQQAFLHALQAQNGIGNQSAVFNQQQQLANQLQGVANGTGPNPAQAALNQATGANVANQAALMAGQRGASANPALMARLAAQQGANTQQQAAGQGATMQAQQQLAAMGALQGQQANMGNLAATQVGQQAGAQTAFNQQALQQQANYLNSVGQLNNARVGMQNNVNSSNAGIAQIAAGNQGQMQSGLMQGAAMAAMAADGGMVEKNKVQPPNSSAKYMADGGMMAPAPITPQASFQQASQMASGPSSSIGQFLAGVSQPDPSMVNQSSAAPSMNKAGSAMGQGLVKGIQSLMGGSGGMSTSGATPMAGLQGDMGSMAGSGAMLANKGAMVPGKAKMKGDNLKNDTVPAMLSPGEVVIPRSVMNSKDPVGEAAKFVQAVLAKQNMKRGNKK